jgi:acetyl-CoA carboxylase biotin carboxyl carrier protein
MPNDRGSPEPIDSRIVRRLALILKETDLTEIEVEQGELRIRVARQQPPPAQVTYSAPSLPMAVQPTPGPAASPAPVAGAPPAAPATPTYDGDPVNSPMVGTVYLQPSPGAAPFVSVGDTVEEGQTLLIIEAMKTMNPIPAPRSGRIVAILVADAQPVEYGEPLAVIG